MKHSRLRAFQPDDLPRLLDVWESASRLAHPFLDDAFFVTDRKAIAEEHMPAAETYVAEQGGVLVGFIALLGDEVGGIFVEPAYHGQGIGRALMDHARSLRGSLELDVFADNRIGRRFYERVGFEAVGERAHAPTGHVLLRLRWPKA